MLTAFVRCTRAWKLEWRNVNVTSILPKATSPRQRCLRELKASTLFTVKLSFRRKQRNAIIIAPQTITTMGVDQSMFGHILICA